MKKLLSGLICIVILVNLLLSNCTVGSAYAENDALVEEEINNNAILENEFADNRVMVVMSNEASLQFNQYDANDFSEIGCNRVSNLSTASEAKVKTASEKVSGASESKSINPTSDIDITNYNQVLCLELEHAGKENVLQVIQELQKRDDVIYAGPDYVIQTCSITPDDEYYGNQWAPETIQLPQAWDITTGSSSVVVGVLDTGIEGTHPDLAGNIDVSLCRDFTSGNTIAVTPTDPKGHGTKVAGIIGAQGNNGSDISGVCWNVTLVSLRILDEQGFGYSSYAASAINYAESQGIPILNLSVGWKGDHIAKYYDYALDTVIENYSGLLVCSAGNNAQNNDNIDHYPSNYDLPNLIAVGASNMSDKMYDSSNYGVNTVDLFAPGEQIYTTFTNHVCARSDGTSMAAPYVTGVAALLLSLHPDLTPAELKHIILNSAEVVMDGSTNVFGSLCTSGGRLNAYNAVTHLAAHSFTTKNQGNSSGHIRTCGCGYSYTEGHRWVMYPTYSQCKVCNAIADMVVRPQILPPKEDLFDLAA
ncbi:MAG: S8 family serine peptidase [Clostridia bacterium]|nr:S8 family serine peptidase [Clostridia bacterium]